MRRKKISNSTRFEVFRRDSFKCQYCGRCAPEVVLELEHIQPHSKGGSDDILNLLTACRECNSGKSDKLLSDDAVVQKQRGQLEELQERREQLEMMLKWRSANVDIEGDAVRAVMAEYERLAPGWSLNESGEQSVRTLIKKFGLARTLEALETAAHQVLRFNRDGNVTSESIGKLIGATFIVAEPPDVQALYKIRSRIRKRWNNVNDGRCIGTLRRLLSLGASVTDIESRCDDLMGTQYTSFQEWSSEMDAWVQELRAGA